MITETRLEAILKGIKADYQGTCFHLFHGNHHGRLWVQVGTVRPDCNTSQVGLGKGGKAYVSEHATEDEVVKKVFGLILAYVEHEAREGFYYKGKRLFGPHITLEALMEAADHTEVRA